MIRRLALVAAILAVLALAGGQDAHAAPPPEGWGAAELSIATDYWGASPDIGCSAYSVEFDAAGLGEEILGWATYGSVEYRGLCVMKIAPATDVALQCAAVVHEYGHWLGYRHSDDPSSIMFWQITNQIPAACAALKGSK